MRDYEQSISLRVGVSHKSFCRAGYLCPAIFGYGMNGRAPNQEINGMNACWHSPEPRPYNEGEFLARTVYNVYEIDCITSMGKRVDNSVNPHFECHI